MSPRTVQRFWDNDMHQNKNLKRVASIRSSATRLRRSLRRKDARLWSQNRNRSLKYWSATAQIRRCRIIHERRASRYKA
ncbi:hypothetical protein FJ423_11260 [Mesorhizobium sp. B2-8-9]|nr:hypothetical protein FJ423_11260 [Mesorhizobium sp. B2-8-9]